MSNFSCFVVVDDVKGDPFVWSTLASASLVGGIFLLRFGYTMFMGTACMTTSFCVFSVLYLLLSTFVDPYVAGGTALIVAVCSGCLISSWLKPALFSIGACGGAMISLKALELIHVDRWTVLAVAGSSALVTGLASLRFVKPMVITMTSCAGAVVTVFAFQIIAELCGNSFCNAYEMVVTASVAVMGMGMQCFASDQVPSSYDYVEMDDE